MRKTKVYKGDLQKSDMFLYLAYHMGFPRKSYHYNENTKWWNHHGINGKKLMWPINVIHMERNAKIAELWELELILYGSSWKQVKQDYKNI